MQPGTRALARSGIIASQDTTNTTSTKFNKKETKKKGKVAGARGHAGEKIAFVDVLKTTAGIILHQIVGLFGTSKIAKDPVKKRSH